MSSVVETFRVVSQSWCRGIARVSLGMTNAAEKIIVALDVGTSKAALTLIGDLCSTVSYFKVGLQLYTV
ncbi:MAG: hypothetical protein WAN04_14840, partial [Candidatus Udaeobacter sp.]